MTDRPGDDAWRRASTRYAWLVVALAAWLVAGLALIGRADFEGLVSDVAVSPYHVPAYAALVVLCVYVLVTVDRGELRQRSWRRSFPRYYDGLVLGALTAVAWLVLDLLWRSLFGIRPGLEGSLAPTRLLIPLALALVASGPLRDAPAGPGDPDARSLRTWAAVVALGLVAIAAGGAIGAFNPVSHSLGARAGIPPQDVSEVWVMAADGSQQTRLLPATEAGVDYSLPAWSPDGSRIAYTRWQNAPGVAFNEASTQQSASIWTMSADGSDARQVVDGAPGVDWIPAWSPDGAWLAFTSTPAGGGAGTGQAGAGQPGAAPGQAPPNAPPSGSVGPPAGAHGSQIRIVRPDGTGGTALTDSVGDSEAPSWSPDGTRIAFSSDRTGDYEIWVMNADGSGPTRLTQDPASDGMPAWSPDGTRIAFASDRTGNNEIWVMNADGSGLVHLTDDPDQNWVPAWSPDGTRIAFTSDRSGEPEVWSMAADGTDPRDLSASPERVDGQWSVAWSPDGTRLAYASAAVLPAVDTPLVTEDLAVAGTLLYSAMLALVAVVLLRIGAPFGSFALVLGMSVLFAAFVADQWRFLPAAVVLGLAVDGAVGLLRQRGGGSPDGRRRLEAVAAAVGLPLALVLAVGLTLAVTGDLGWSPTLLLGVAITTVAIGLTVAAAST